MKVVVDSCGWIEWLTDGPLSAKFGAHLKQLEHIIVPTVVQYELFKWVCRERDEDTAYEVIALTNEGTVVPIESSLALFAAEISRQHKLAMADAFVYATARQHNAKVVTSDSHFCSLSHVEYYPTI